MHAHSKLLSGIALVALVVTLVATAAPVQAARQANRLAVTTTAQAGFTRTYNWKLISQAAPALWTLRSGDDAVSQVGVRLDAAGHQDSEFTVAGAVRITNPARTAAILTAVTETLSPGARRAAVACPVRLPHRLAPGAVLECTYTARLPRALNGTVRAKVTTRGAVSGAAAASSFAFSAPTREVNAGVRITAGGQSFGPYTAPASLILQQPVDCASGEASIPSQIVETGQTASAQVSVVCFDLEIDKSTQTFRDGDAWGMRGTIAVRNAGAAPSFIASVIEELEMGELPVQVDCGYDFAAGAYRLDPGATLACAFSAALPDTAERYTLTRVTAETSHYEPDGSRTVTGASDYLAGPDPLGFVE